MRRRRISMCGCVAGPIREQHDQRRRNLSESLGKYLGNAGKCMKVLSYAFLRLSETPNEVSICLRCALFLTGGFASEIRNLSK